MKTKRGIGILLTFVIVLGTASAMALVYQESSPPAPPFPNVVRGTRVTWIPDKEVRAVAADLTPADVECIKLSGGGQTGVPTNVTITHPATIALFLKGMRQAVKRNDDHYYQEVCGNGPCPGVGAPVDTLCLYRRPKQGIPREAREMVFFADLMEGEQLFMPCGTVSPRFQDALRAAGIPKRPAITVAQGYIDLAKTTAQNW